MAYLVVVDVWWVATANAQKLEGCHFHLRLLKHMTIFVSHQL